MSSDVSAVDNSISPIPSLIRSSTFKLTAALTMLFTGSTLLLFAFIYWQTISAETLRIERELTSRLLLMPKEDDAALAEAIEMRLITPGHRLNYAGLFSPTGQPLMGNIYTLPKFPHLNPKDGSPNVIHKIDMQIENEQVMMVGEVLKDRRILVIGRSADSVDTFGSVLIEAMERGIIPAVFLSLIMGLITTAQSHARIKIVSRSIEKIMQGELHVRLPTRNDGVEIDHLASSVNTMLDEIELLMEDAKSTGGNIAHDIRAPLTWVRTRLERACRTSQSHQELMTLVEQGISGLDHALRIVSALLRIGQLENRQMRSSFTQLDLGTIIREVGEMFEPLAEEKNIAFTVQINVAKRVSGDGELISEAIVNLVDNALKFTPEGGKVRVEATEMEGIPVIRVIDNGPGIHPDEYDLVRNRFYRSNHNRHEKGNGLGLNIVRAIAQLHGFKVTVQNLNPGCMFELSCFTNQH